MSNTAGEKTTQHLWDEVWTDRPKMRLPSGLNVGVRNIQRVLESRVKRRGDFLEVGCAPGKLLAWAASELPVQVAGVDYSAPGVKWSRELFDALGLRADIRCEDFFATTFAPESFDYVFSAGVIEHFDDPTDIIARHVALLRPGGVAIIMVPNYGGFYGRLQGRLDPDNLAIHNVGMMSVERLPQYVKAADVEDVRAYPAGSFSPWIVNLDKVLPQRLARIAGYFGNLFGLLQPIEMPALCPLLVLEIRKGSRRAEAMPRLRKSA